MKILPTLDMNGHPEKTTNCSMVDAINVMLSKDNFAIQTEPKLESNIAQVKLNNILSNYKIIYSIPCNKEIVFFVNENKTGKVSLYRYNEEKLDIVKSTEIEYSNGNFVGTFTYNNDELIIAFSEYFLDDSKNIPLRTINLGKFNQELNKEDKKQLNLINLHSICPVVRIPNVSFNQINGYANVGWYYIFIRYKISNNTYTQWFNTNESVFIYNYKHENLVYNFIGPSAKLSKEDSTNYESTETVTNTYEIAADVDIAENKNMSSKSYWVEFTNLDTDYIAYQVGFINITKSSTKAYRTNDTPITKTGVAINNKFLYEYSANELINTTYNYYNAKTLINHSNRLYIANYNEENNIDAIKTECKNITCSIEIKTEEKTFDINNFTPVQVKFLPHQAYNFFIHFVDKYGKVYDGINLNDFKFDYADKIINGINQSIIVTPDVYVEMVENKLKPSLKNTFKYYDIDIKLYLNKLPTNCVGYFISYEKLRKVVKYSGITASGKGNPNNIASFGDYFKVYSDKFNFEDKLDFVFDTVRIFETNKSFDKLYDGTVFDVIKSYLNRTYYVTNNTPVIRTSNNRGILVADAANNILSSTAAKIYGQNYTKNSYCELCDEHFTNFYNSRIKTLIPCSQIYYGVNFWTPLNSHGAFVTRHHAITFNNSYYDDTNKYYRKPLYVGAIKEPFWVCEWFGYDELPWESLQYNNDPVVQFYPAIGLSTTDTDKKSFVPGTILECKNTIDLFQQTNVTYEQLYPKALNWHDETVINQTNFPKTIRRSKPIQDESHTNNWRYFDSEQYKNIIENKGNIIKLISIGYYFIAHTQHSMFLFNSTNTIQSEEGKIQLANTDIWDINYQEILTSSLGYAGIKYEWNGIVGSFGYIFYDWDGQRLYRYDNQQVKPIDDDIINYVKRLKDYDVNFVEDKQRNRIFVKFNKNTNNIVLSYNYNSQTFVSRHNYTYDKGYNTKENLYLITNEQHKIQDFESHTFNNEASIDIMLNANYEMIKSIDFITYKIKQLDYIDEPNYSPVEGTLNLYAGNKLKIYNDICSTGDVDISVDNELASINNTNAYKKPYWRLGNWNYNYIRNNIDKYDNKQISKSEANRVVGNYFIVHFEFNSDKQVEFESIEGKLTNCTLL